MSWTVDLLVPERALAIGAHADDIEFECGATLAKWSAAGCEVSHLVCTDGSKGTWDLDADIDALRAVRRDEQREAARRLGATGEVVFTDWVDGELDSSMAARSIVAEWIRRLQPEVVLGHDPWQRYRLHPDHRHAGWLTVDGSVAARDPFFFPDHDSPHHRPEWLLLFEADEPNHLEDVTGFGDVKVDALLAHDSQLLTTMRIDDAAADEQVARFRAEELARLHTTGQEHGLESAEAFRRISLT